MSHGVVRLGKWCCTRMISYGVLSTLFSTPLSQKAKPRLDTQYGT